MARTQANDNSTSTDKVEITENISQTNVSETVTETPASAFICHAEFLEDGKTIHYLYNPEEKDPTKAWKKSENCKK